MMPDPICIKSSIEAIPDIRAVKQGFFHSVSYSLLGTPIPEDSYYFFINASNGAVTSLQFSIGSKAPVRVSDNSFVLHRFSVSAAQIARDEVVIDEVAAAIGSRCGVVGFSKISVVSY